MNRLVQTTKLFVKRNSSTILTCVGAAGVVTTSVMAVKATPKAMMLLDKAKEEKGSELTKWETVNIAGPVYIPSVIVGLSTITCIFGANLLNKRHQASLMSAYALLDSSYKDYRSKVQELYGDDANLNVITEIAKDEYAENDISVSDGTQLFYDAFSARYFESTMEEVLFQEYEVNRVMAIGEGVYLNYFYDNLGLDHEIGYDDLGWSCGSMYDIHWHPWIEFEHTKTTMDDGLECTIITMPLEPYPYLEY